MTPAQINAAIATWMGWKEIVLEPLHYSGAEGIPPDAAKLRPDGGPNYWPVLNYHGDLNACASFEAKLSDGDQAFYTHHILCMTVWLKNPENDNSKIRWALMTATAPQRAEALLRTIGKWKE